MAATKTAKERTKTARERMVESTALLMRREGVKGTSFSDVLQHAAAPRGSIYHHFPGGKTQLVEEATRYAGDFIAAGLAAALQEDDPIAGLDAIEGFWRSLLENSNFTEGCPIVAAGLAGEQTPEARDAAGEVFRRWQGILVESMVRRGIPEERARSIAALSFAATEGGAIMARAQRSMEPLEGVFVELRRALVDALDEPKAAVSS
jgi:AcrR family transcriptional regulator